MDASIDTAIETKLRQAWRQERRYFHLRGASRFVLWLIALLALAFVIDWGLFARTGMNVNIGLLLLVVNIAILGWVLWSEWLRYLKPYDPVHVSLAVEKRHPGFSSLLVSYMQLREPAPDQPNVSAELIDAMREQAVDKARPLDFREIVDFNQIRKLVTVAGCVLLVFAVLSISWNEHFGVFLKRLAGYGDDYPTNTKIVEHTGALTVRIGDNAIITATAGDAIPEAGRLFTRPAGSDADWKELPMKAASKQDTFARELKGLSQDVEFYVRLGDARSEPCRIRVIDSPQIVETSIDRQFPDYMDLPAATTEQLNVTVPEGTRLRWTLVCDPPVKRCLVTINGDTQEAEVLEGGTKVVFPQPDKEPVKATGNFRYTFRWTEAESAQDFEYDDVEYAVQVEPDELPEVELLSPASNSLATVQKVLRIAAKASDDHGLANAWLVYSVDGSKEKRLDLHDFKGSKATQFERPWMLQKEIKELKPGNQVTVAIEVADHHPNRDNHTRRSATRQLTIVDPEIYLDWYRAELAAQTDELKRSRAAEITSATAVDNLKKEEGQPQ